MTNSETVFKARVKSVIERPLEYDMDEIACRKWMALLPESKRYVNNKIRICKYKISLIELELELIEAEISESIRKRGSGSVTERKAIIEATFRKDPRYEESYTKIYKYQKLMDKYYADLDNLTEKSFAVRKIADFEKTHLMYETDD